MAKYDVLAIGELNVDLVMAGFTTPPTLGQEIFADSLSLVLGSSTAIAACAMSAIGLGVGFYGKTGTDPYGQVVMDFLKRYQVDTSFVQADSAIKTGITVALSCGYDRALCTFMGDSIDGFTAYEVPDEAIKSARHIHVGSFFLQPKIREGLCELFAKARSYGVTTSLDAGWDDTRVFDYGIRDVLAHTDFFFPNETEAAHITGHEDVPSAARELAQYCKTAIVKCGEKGAYMVSGDTVLEGKPYPTTPIDTTGAGDTFNAGFLYAYLNGKSFEECLKYGNAAGSISVTRMGGTTACPTLAEVKALIS
ncbi:MAG: carbohydrate kinase family protein [Defluviitaleaceae bacterium]|nr:carbohydrate kinase family protein [Defluviitaleaceae bacterium]